MIRKLAKYYAPHMKLFIADMLAATLVAGCNLFYPMLTREIINSYVPDHNLRMMLQSAVVLALIYVLKACLNYFIQYYGHVMGVRIQVDIRKDAFEHLQRLPFKYFDRTKTGTIMSRIIGDAQDISELAHHGPEDIFISELSRCRNNIDYPDKQIIPINTEQPCNQG